MTDQGYLTFPAQFSQTLKKHGNRNAMTFVGEKPLTYNEVYTKVNALIALFEKLGIQPGDKVAVLGANMPSWGISYYATTFMGAIVVPMLPDFSRMEIENILSHSEAKAIVVSESTYSKVKDMKVQSLSYRIKMEDFSMYDNEDDSIFFDPDAIPKREYDVKEDDLAAIIYTSGTTGNSKGVMLTHKNICFTAHGGKKIQPIEENDRFLSILPLSHTYENTLGFILAMLGGACIYYLRKPPTPPILLPALKEVKPTIMLTVPLIIEKIFRSKILPALTGKWYMKAMYKVSFIRKFFHRQAGKELMKTFGGHIKFFGIGGAKLNATVEQFLLDAKFPYAIGYGLTETSPLLAGTSTKNTTLQSTGKAMYGVELKIHNPDETGEGEIWARGANIMKGYYKEPELTAQVLTEDGWFKTGDLGVMNKDKFLYIKGRTKNVILGSSGENIYPEEIESVINDFEFVVESLVVQQKGKLVALVHFNHEEIEKRFQHLKEDVKNFVEHKTEELRKELHSYVNSKVNKFSKIHIIKPQPVPFKKTATQKIKRFLYHS